MSYFSSFLQSQNDKIWTIFSPHSFNQLIIIIVILSFFGQSFINCNNNNDQNKISNDKQQIVTNNQQQPQQPIQPQSSSPQQQTAPAQSGPESRQITSTGHSSPHHSYNQDQSASNINVYTHNLSPKETAHHQANPNAPIGYIQIQPMLANPLASLHQPESQGSTTFLSFIKPQAGGRRSFSLTNKLKNFMSSLFSHK